MSVWEVGNGPGDKSFVTEESNSTEQKEVFQGLLWQTKQVVKKSKREQTIFCFGTKTQNEKEFKHKKRGALKTHLSVLFSLSLQFATLFVRLHPYPQVVYSASLWIDNKLVDPQ